jgi:hypothetical protein
MQWALFVGEWNPKLRLKIFLDFALPNEQGRYQLGERDGT